MIATTDIANILYEDCKAFNIDIVPFGKTLIGELQGERIIIHVKQITPEIYWEKCFAEINFCIPNTKKEYADTRRLNEIERRVKEYFKGKVGVHNDTSYYYRWENISIEADTALKCHFVNCKVLFNSLNTM